MTHNLDPTCHTVVSGPIAAMGSINIWFPRTREDLDKCGDKILEGGKDLKTDHPVS